MHKVLVFILGYCRPTSNLILERVSVIPQMQDRDCEGQTLGSVGPAGIAPSSSRLSWQVCMGNSFATNGNCGGLRERIMTSVPSNCRKNSINSWRPAMSL